MLATNAVGVLIVSTGTILLIILIVLLIAGFPSWPHSRSWGYTPSGVIFLILIVVLIMMLIGAV